MQLFTTTFRIMTEKGPKECALDFLSKYEKSTKAVFRFADLKVWTGANFKTTDTDPSFHIKGKAFKKFLYPAGDSPPNDISLVEYEEYLKMKPEKRREWEGVKFRNGLVLLSLRGLDMWASANSQPEESMIPWNRIRETLPLLSMDHPQAINCCDPTEQLYRSVRIPPILRIPREHRADTLRVVKRMALKLKVDHYPDQVVRYANIFRNQVTNWRSLTEEKLTMKMIELHITKSKTYRSRDPLTPTRLKMLGHLEGSSGIWLDVPDPEEQQVSDFQWDFWRYYAECSRKKTRSRMVRVLASSSIDDMPIHCILTSTKDQPFPWPVWITTPRETPIFVPITGDVSMFCSHLCTFRREKHFNSRIDPTNVPFIKVFYTGEVVVRSPGGEVKLTLHDNLVLSAVVIASSQRNASIAWRFARLATGITDDLWPIHKWERTAQNFKVKLGTFLSSIGSKIVQKRGLGYEGFGPMSLSNLVWQKGVKATSDFLCRWSINTGDDSMSWEGRSLSGEVIAKFDLSTFPTPKPPGIVVMSDAQKPSDVFKSACHMNMKNQAQDLEGKIKEMNTKILRKPLNWVVFDDSTNYIDPHVLNKCASIICTRITKSVPGWVMIFRLLGWNGTLVEAKEEHYVLGDDFARRAEYTAAKLGGINFREVRYPDRTEIYAFFNIKKKVIVWRDNEESMTTKEEDSLAQLRQHNMKRKAVLWEEDESEEKLTRISDTTSN